MDEIQEESNAAAEIGDRRLTADCAFQLKMTFVLLENVSAVDRKTKVREKFFKSCRQIKLLCSQHFFRFRSTKDIPNYSVGPH